MDAAFIPIVLRSLSGPRDAEAIDQAGERILNAALDEAAARGTAGLTTEGVARRAGVNRATVYRRFGDRDSLLAAVAVREGRRMAEALADATAGIDDPDERFVEGFVTALRLAREHPVIARAVRYEPGALIEAGLVHNAALLRIGGAFMTAAICEAQSAGRARHLDAVQAGETAARMFAAFVLLPGGVVDLGDDAAARRYAQQTWAPMLLGPVDPGGPSRNDAAAP